MINNGKEQQEFGLHPVFNFSKFQGHKALNDQSIEILLI